MKFSRTLALTVLAALAPCGETRAQRGEFYTPLGPTARERGVDAGGLPSPYGGGAREAESNGYRRTPSTPPPRSREPAEPRRAAHNYFPTLRTGQGPNRNVINPRTLCVPGRRAMLQR